MKFEEVVPFGLGVFVILGGIVVAPFIYSNVSGFAAAENEGNFLVIMGAPIAMIGGGALIFWLFWPFESKREQKEAKA